LSKWKGGKDKLVEKGNAAKGRSDQGGGQVLRRTGRRRKGSEDKWWGKNREKLVKKKKWYKGRRECQPRETERKHRSYLV